MHCLGVGNRIMTPVYLGSRCRFPQRFPQELVCPMPKCGCPISEFQALESVESVEDAMWELLLERCVSFKPFNKHPTNVKKHQKTLRNIKQTSRIIKKVTCLFIFSPWSSWRSWAFLRAHNCGSDSCPRVQSSTGANSHGIFVSLASHKSRCIK